MANSKRKKRATSGIDLFLDFSRESGPHLRARIENGLREAIRTGRLTRGTRLPPTRALARDLDVSRGTLLEVYAQLVAEGWIAGRQGSSTVVAFDTGPSRSAPPIRSPSPMRWRFDLRPGRPDPSSFPRAEWLRALRRALASAPDEAFGYGSPQGQVSLRIELAGYLGRARGLHAVPEDLLITTGFTQGLGLVARSLAARGVRRIAMEEPSMALHRSILRAAGHELVSIPVDSDGMRVDELEHGRRVGMVVLTPSRQHPTGATLSATRRSRLLAWARANGTVIVEDDYDGEFRYDRRPIGPLQGLDPRVVVYAGTVSKTLSPGVRLGWLVLPKSLKQDMVRQKEITDWQNSALEQLAFAEMLRSGAYDRHIRKMRLRYRHRRDMLILALTKNHPTLVVKGTEAGLNLLIPAPDASAEAAAIAAARAAGIGLDGLILGGYYESPGPAGLLVGYGATPQHAFRASVDALILALSDVVSDWPLLAEQT